MFDRIPLNLHVFFTHLLKSVTFMDCRQSSTSYGGRHPARGQLHQQYNDQEEEAEEAEARSRHTGQANNKWKAALPSRDQHA